MVDTQTPTRLWTFAAVMIAALTIMVIVTAEIGICPLIESWR